MPALDRFAFTPQFRAIVCEAVTRGLVDAIDLAVLVATHGAGYASEREILQELTEIADAQRHDRGTKAARRWLATATDSYFAAHYEATQGSDE